MHNEVRLSIRTRNLSLRDKIFGLAAVDYNSAVELKSGLKITSKDVQNVKAFGGIDIVNISVAAAVSLPTSLLAQWIWEMLTKSDTMEINLNGVTLSGNKEQISELLESLGDTDSSANLDEVTPTDKE